MPRTPIFRNVLDPNNFEHRKTIITRIQDQLGGKLITYHASPTHPLAQIMLQDAPLFEDLLRSVANSDTGYLMITSLGGDPNTAEKLLLMCRERFTKKFNVIVPDYAKSAATMIALGSDKVLMGYLAELGPIDPQIQIEPFPKTEMLPARSFIDGLNMIRERITKHNDPVMMYLPMLSKIRPEIIAICEGAIDNSQDFAEKWLKRYMLKDNHEQAKLVAKWLSSGAKYKSHGKVIDFTEAKDELKLNVEKIDLNSELWTAIWELYCRSYDQLQRNAPVAAKLFESESVSLNMNINIIFQGPQNQTPSPSIPPSPIQPPTQPPPES